MKDMIPKGTGNSRFLRSVSNFKAIYPTYDDFVNALVAGNLPVDFNGINEAGIQQVGTSLNKANLLTDETAAALGLDSDDPTVDEAFGRLNQHLTDVEAHGAKIEVGSYVGTGTYGSSNPKELSFMFEPKLVLVGMIKSSNNITQAPFSPTSNGWQSCFIWVKGQTQVHVNSYTLTLTLLSEGKTLSFYSTKTGGAQCNDSGGTYIYLAIG